MPQPPRPAQRSTPRGCVGLRFANAPLLFSEMEEYQHDEDNVQIWQLSSDQDFINTIVIVRDGHVVREFHEFDDLAIALD